MERRTRSSSGISYIVGADEAGRGPLAGPVVVAAVAIPEHTFDATLKIFSGVRESKQLTAKGREVWFKRLEEARTQGKLTYASAAIGAAYIDARGITRAVHEALERSLFRLSLPPQSCEVLLDGLLHAPAVFLRQQTITRGDETEPIIALASIIAKVRRDRMMVRFARRYPQYGFERHKGYGTAAHIRALQEHGFSLLHRWSYCRSIVLAKP